jgi:hypothetical protein
MTVDPCTTGPGGVATSPVDVAMAGPCVTLTTTADDADPANAVVLGTKVAVNEWLPADSVGMALVAVPAATVTGAPRAAVPSRNWT